MLEINYEGTTYSRLLSNSVTKNVTTALKENNDYSFIVSYDGIIEDDSYSLLDKKISIKLIFRLSNNNPFVTIVTIGLFLKKFFTVLSITSRYSSIFFDPFSKSDINLNISDKFSK